MEEYNQTQNQTNQDQPEKIDNHMPLSIVSLVLGVFSPCCIGFILGIISIVFSSQVNTKYALENYEGAKSSSKTAKILAFIAIGLTVINLIYVVTQIKNAGGIEAYIEQYQQMLEKFQR